jgi:hypothetical protein
VLGDVRFGAHNGLRSDPRHFEKCRVEVWRGSFRFEHICCRAFRSAVPYRLDHDPETLSEQRFDGERARQIFEEANRRHVAGLG